MVENGGRIPKAPFRRFDGLGGSAALPHPLETRNSEDSSQGAYIVYIAYMPYGVYIAYTPYGVYIEYMPYGVYIAYTPYGVYTRMRRVP